MAGEQHHLGWVGLGRMGYPMAERLLKAGHPVTAWNRTRTKAEPLAAKGARIAENLAEITVLAQKAGVPRHAFLDFINDSVMGSIFTRYKTNALVNLDWTTTFTPELLRKDLDLGLAAARQADVPMPVTAATREALQAHFGAARLQPNPQAYLAGDFAATLETVALGAGLTLEPENVPMPTGLEVEG